MNKVQVSKQCIEKLLSVYIRRLSPCPLNYQTESLPSVRGLWTATFARSPFQYFKASVNQSNLFGKEITGPWPIYNLGYPSLRQVRLPLRSYGLLMSDGMRCYQMTFYLNKLQGGVYLILGPFKQPSSQQGLDHCSMEDKQINYVISNCPVYQL